MKNHGLMRMKLARIDDYQFLLATQVNFMLTHHVQHHARLDTTQEEI